MVNVEDRSFHIVACVCDPQLMRAGRKASRVEEHGVEVFVCSLNVALVGGHVAVEGDRVASQSSPIPAVDPDKPESISMVYDISG